MIQISASAGNRHALPVSILVGGLFYAAAGGLLWLAWTIHKAGQEVATWVEVPARVEQVELKEVSSGDTESYHLVCEYLYTWNDTEFRSDVISRTGMPGRLGELTPIYDQWAKSQDEGTTIPAFVNPDAPSESVLRREAGTAIIAICVTLAGFFVVITTVVIVASYVKRPKD